MGDPAAKVGTGRPEPRLNPLGPGDHRLIFGSVSAQHPWRTCSSQGVRTRRTGEHAMMSVSPRICGPTDTDLAEYLRQIRAVPLLSPEEERELSLRYRRSACEQS